MKLAKAERSGDCDVVDAYFSWGMQACNRVATWQTEEDGEWFFICDKHIAQQREAEASN